MLRSVTLALIVLLASESGASNGAPAAPGPVPPNASRITATVRSYTARVAGEAAAGTADSSDAALATLTVEVETSAPEDAAKRSFAVPKQVIEVFSKDSVPPDLVGHRIKGNLRLTGSTQGVRWWISNVRKLP